MKELEAYDKLFLVGMTNSGTTITHRLLNRCNGTAWMAREGRIVLHKYMHKTGNTIAPPECEWDDFRVYTERLDELANKDYYNWDKIKEVWWNSWSADGLTYPTLLIECSPSNPARMDMLRSQFSNCKLLVLVRNPYAVIEGIKRYSGISLDRIVEHVGKVMKMLLYGLRTDIHWISYEQIVDKPEELAELLESTYEYIDGFEEPGEFDVQNIQNHKGGLKNFNKKQIQRMAADQLRYCFNELQKLCKGALGFFGYDFHPLELYSI